MQNVIVLNADLKILNNLTRYNGLEKLPPNRTEGGFFYLCGESVFTYLTIKAVFPLVFLRFLSYTGINGTDYPCIKVASTAGHS